MLLLLSLDSVCTPGLSEAGGAFSLTGEAFLSKVIDFPSLVTIIVPDMSVRYICIPAALSLSSVWV